MDSETRSVTELREHLIEKATTDEAFRARLLADPNAAIQEELGVTVPPGFTIKVHEGRRGRQPPGAAAGRAARGGRNGTGGRGHVEGCVGPACGKQGVARPAGMRGAGACGVPRFVWETP